MIGSQLLTGILLGPFINVPFTLGEELGWRAYLLPKLADLYGRAAGHPVFRLDLGPVARPHDRHGPQLWRNLLGLSGDRHFGHGGILPGRRLL